jgi:outer membrane protein assembly factor BamB
MTKKFISSLVVRGFLIAAFLMVGQPTSFQPVNIVSASTDAQEMSAAATDWPMYMHDPAHSGRTPAAITNTALLKLKWAYSFGERVEVEAQPIVVGGVVYQGVMNGEMHAINGNTGQALWVKRYGGPIAHTAAFDNNRVFYGSLDGKVYALSAVDGSLLWSFTTHGPVVSAPAVINGKVYIGSNDGRLYALDAVTGAKQWEFLTDGPVVSSPAVVNGKVYFGSEDMKARCVDAATGTLIWQTQLTGFGMRNTHPVVSDLSPVVIFTTVKPGGFSYVPLEGYPNAPAGANPVDTWNTYYQTYPAYRTLFYLDSNSGVDKWDKANKRFVPFPLPYWGLIQPILGPDGEAWFPAAAGTVGFGYTLDHDNRLFKTNLASGETLQEAGGSGPEFQHRMDEVGRQVFAGRDYYTTISEDLGVYRPDNNTLAGLYGDKVNTDGSGFVDYGTHMNPLSALPSRHLWRYGGAVAMGGVPGASIPVVANNMIYYTSYSWMYAVGTTSPGYSPTDATRFPPRDTRLNELTNPRLNTPSLNELRSELDQRISDIIALGPNNPPIAARWEQAAASGRMLYNEWAFDVYGFDGDLVRGLSMAYPQLSPGVQAQLKIYLASLVNQTLLNTNDYAHVHQCLIYGQSGMKTGDATCAVTAGKIIADWWADNPNLVGLRLYALWTYADATGDWTALQSKWAFIKQQFQPFITKYDPALGFIRFDEWRTGRLNLPAQIAAAQSVRDMADHFGDTAMKSSAQTLLTNLLNGRVALANFIPNLYATGQRTTAQIRINADGTLNHADIMGPGSPYNKELIPYDAALRDRNTDPSQVNWWDGSTYRVDAGIGFQYYQALSGYYPLTSELTNRLRTSLFEKTRYYVKSYEVNQPWWWMADLAHQTTGSGEDLYISPTLSWTMFQVKARVLGESPTDLIAELPEPVSFNAKYDPYRIENIATLLELVDITTPNFSPSEITPQRSVVFTGETVPVTVRIENTGVPLAEPLSLDIIIPTGLSYKNGTLNATLPTPNQSNPLILKWEGVMDSSQAVNVTFDVGIIEAGAKALQISAVLHSASAGDVPLQATVIVNPTRIFLAYIRR